MATMMTRSPTLESAKSRFRPLRPLRVSSFGFGTFASTPARRSPRASDVEEDLRYGDEIVHVERPAQHHLDGQTEHRQPQEHHDVKTGRPQTLVVALQPAL